MKIFVWGNNYSPNNKEASSAFSKQPPFLFLKPDSSLLKDGKPFFLPDFLSDVQASVAVVVRLNRLGKSVPSRFASRYYAEATVGVNLMACGELHRLRQQGLPWDAAVGFDGAAVLGNFIAWPLAEKEGEAGKKPLHFSLYINGNPVQSGCTGDLSVGVDEGISRISRLYTLKTGDLIYTGYPAEGSPLSVGDHLEGYLEDEKLLDFYIR